MKTLSVRGWAVVVGALVGVVAAAVLSWALETQSYNVWGAVIVVPVVVAINAILIWRVSRRPDEPWLAGVMATAFVAKIIGTVVRYFVAYVVYGGVADAEGYNLYAVANFRAWRDGTVTWEWGGKQGTQYMELITTAVYAAIGPSPLAGFVVFTSLAFWGQYLLFRAFRTALPDGNGRRYALLVLLLPSMLYWPSSIGKESWLMLFVGVTALGAARFFAREPRAWSLLALGAVGTAIVRPHIAVLLFAAVVVAQLFRPTTARSTGILTKGMGILVMAGAAIILTTQTASFLGIDDFSWQAIAESVDSAGGKTAQGGSAFTPTPLDSPLGVLMAGVTVLFRPFPWEATNAQMFLQSLEGIFLLVLVVNAWPRIRRVPRLLRGSPYVTFVVVYVGGFILAFSGFGNFGILARQRVLMLPFFLVLLALPPIERLRKQPRQDKVLERAPR